MTSEDIALKASEQVKKGGKAQGEPVFQGALNEYSAPMLTPDLAWRYLTQNIHLRNNLVNMQVQIFPEEPTVDVIDVNENVDEAATTFIRKQWYAVQGYASMQRSWIDRMGFGCSVKSPGYGNKNGEYAITEIRDIPAIKFRTAPSSANLNGVCNALMPGIVYDPETGDVRVWQSDNNGIAKTEITNFVIIRDPADPAPAGIAYCLPCYPVISAIDNANKAADQQVMRTGAPLIFPQLTAMNDGLKKWGTEFIRRWGKNVGFVLPPGVTFANPMIHESDSATQRLDKLISWVDNYFNPTTVLRKTGGQIGGTDMGMMAIWNNYISGTQAWLEYAYEEMLNPVLIANGYSERYVRIRLKRPQLDRATERREQVKIGILGKAITSEEIRKNLSELDLPELDDDIQAQLDTLYAVQPSSPFGQQPSNPFGLPPEEAGMFGNMQFTNADGENWITINGAHIPLKDGETKAEAFERTTGDKLSGGSGKSKGSSSESGNGSSSKSKTSQTKDDWSESTYEKTLSKSEIDAVDEYRGPGQFQDINAYARTGQIPGGSSLTKEKASGIISKMDRAVLNSPPIPEGTEIYSGIGKTQGAEVLALPVGGSFEDKDFQSFSTDITRAKSASGSMKKGNNQDRVVIKFDGDGTTRGINIGGSEGEIILGRDKKFVITKKEKITETRKKLTGTEKINYHVVHVKLAGEQFKSIKSEWDSVGKNGVQFGNVQNPVQKTPVLRETDKELAAHVQKCKEDVMRIVREKIKP